MSIKAKDYLLATVHRPSNTEKPENLRNILTGLRDIGEKIIFPVPPRTRQKLDETYRKMFGSMESHVRLIEPVGYLDMLVLERNARMILTDSGGVQKEAYWFGVPCITLRDETEWTETVNTGWNLVVGTESARIVQAARSFQPPSSSDVSGRRKSFTTNSCNLMRLGMVFRVGTPSLEEYFRRRRYPIMPC